jgi:DNA invertase Pin-like site-specific DNA recombinase
MINKKPVRVGVYLRVSTDEQTTENQRIDLMRVAEQRGWTITEVYEDRAVSGAKARNQRPAFQRMVNDAAKGRINMVAAWALDRLGRSARDVINFISDLPDQGVSLYLHKEQLDSSTPVGKLVLTIMAGVAEMEHGRLGERIRAGIARRRAQGKSFGRPHKELPRKTRDQILTLRRAKHGIGKIARQLGIGVSKVSEVLKEAA